MAKPTKSQIEDLIGEISIAAVRSWLRSKGLTHSASSREALTKRISKLVQQEKLTLEELRTGAIQLEEASSKRVILFHLRPEDVRRLKLRGPAQSKSSYSNTPRRAPKTPQTPTVVYLYKDEKQVRLKFAETQTRVRVDVINDRMSRVRTTKIIVAIVDLESGILQLRVDSSEDLHRHTDVRGRPKDGLYVAYYLEKVRDILGCEPEPIDLQPILKRLSEAEPRIVEIGRAKVRTGANSKWRMASPRDIRDDPDYKVAHSRGGKAWAHEEGAVRWIAEASSGKLTRNLFTDINANEGILRVLADCHDAEIEYAVARIREYEKKTPRS